MIFRESSKFFLRKCSSHFLFQCRSVPECSRFLTHNPISSRQRYATYEPTKKRRVFKHSSIIKKVRQLFHQLLYFQSTDVIDRSIRTCDHYNDNFAIEDRRIFINLREKESEIYVSIGGVYAL